MRIYIILTLLILIIPISFAAQTYQEVGTTAKNFNINGSGTFNANRATNDIGISSTSLSDGRLSPLVFDWDGDGDSEIVVISDDSMLVYEDSTLAITDSIVIDTTQQTYSNVVVFDYDGDGLLELLVATEEDRIINVFNYSSSNIQLQKTYDYGTISSFVDGGGSRGTVYLMCAEVNECAIVGTKNENSCNSGVCQWIKSIPFDSTNFTSTTATTLHSYTGAAGNDGIFCLPTIRTPVVDDYDLDGTKEYIFSYLHATETGGSGSASAYIQVMENVSDTAASGGAGTSVSGASFSCSGMDFGSYLTNALSVDFDDGWDGTKNEFAVGYRTSATDFRFTTYRNDFGDSENFPDLTTVDGTIVGSLMYGSALTDSNGKDICMLGFDPNNQEMNLLCGTNGRGFLVDDEEIFDYSTAGQGSFNITNTNDINGHIYDRQAHLTQMDSTLQDGDNLNELLTSYGVFQITDSGLDLTRLYQNPAGRSALIAVDHGRLGANDLVAMTDVNLFYFDDELTNGNARIDTITYNPCITDSVAQANTTLEMQITVSDLNDDALGFYDNVFLEVIIYDGLSNEHNQTFNNISTSQTTGSVVLSSSFILNQTGTGIITFNAWDESNPTDIDTETQSFTVAGTGVQFGECSSTSDVTGEVAAAVGELPTVETQADNGLTTGVNEVGGLLGMSSSLIWYIAMLVVALAIWAQTGGASTYATFGIVAIVEAIMLVLGWSLNFISTGILLIFVILGLTAIGMWLGKRAVGSPS